MIKSCVRKSSLFYLSICISIVCIFISCSAPKKIQEPTTTVGELEPVFNPSSYFDESALRLYNMAKAFPNNIQSRMRNARKDSLQIRVTMLVKGGEDFTRANEAIFQSQKGALIEAGFTNKIALALACAKKMQRYKANGISYNTTMITEAASDNLSGAYNDPYAANGKPSIGRYLGRMLMYNDVEAYNRILELVTIPYLNDFVRTNGWLGTYNSSRLGRQYSSVENGTMNLINFYDDNNQKIYTQPNSTSNSLSKNLGLSNSTTLSDAENILQALFTDKQKQASLAKEIGEEQLEYIKVMLLNEQGQVQVDEANESIGSGSLFFPSKKFSRNFILIPLKNISKKGMSEVLYFFDGSLSKHFILSASLIFKPHSTAAQYQKELREGKAFFEDLGKMVLAQ